MSLIFLTYNLSLVSKYLSSAPVIRNKILFTSKLYSKDINFKTVTLQRLIISFIYVSYILLFYYIKDYFYLSLNNFENL